MTVLLVLSIGTVLFAALALFTGRSLAPTSLDELVLLDGESLLFEGRAAVLVEADGSPRDVVNPATVVATSDRIVIARGVRDQDGDELPIVYVASYRREVPAVAVKRVPYVGFHARLGKPVVEHLDPGVHAALSAGVERAVAVIEIVPVDEVQPAAPDRLIIYTDPSARDGDYARLL